MSKEEMEARFHIKIGLTKLFNEVREVELSREDILEIVEQELDIVYEEFMQGITSPVEAEVERELENQQLLNLAKKLRDHD